MRMTEREAYIALNMVPRMGPATVANGVEALGSAAAFFKAGSAALVRVRGIGRESAELFACAFNAVDWRGEMERAASLNTALLTPADAGYPPLLRAIRDPPLALYVAGDARALSAPCVGIVGTRAPTPYGRANAAAFSAALANAGYAVVSGLARGIDTEAHKAALAARGTTVAVLGAALDKLYPAENRALAREIVANRGAVVSEYPFGRAADRQTFPMRNRIISGLSRGVLVVEAGVTSGTMITAGQSLEQGRAVMAVPGRIDNEAAAGCHRLIAEGARLAATPDDVLDELRSFNYAATAPAPAPTGTAITPASPAPELRPRPNSPEPALNEEEKRIVAALRNGETTIADLAEASGVTGRKFPARLTSLEMKSVIRRIGENRVRLNDNHTQES